MSQSCSQPNTIMLHTISWNMIYVTILSILVQNSQSWHKWARPLENNTNKLRISAGIWLENWFEYHTPRSLASVYSAQMSSVAEGSFRQNVINNNKNHILVTLAPRSTAYVWIKKSVRLRNLTFVISSSYLKTYFPGLSWASRLYKSKHILGITIRRVGWSWLCRESPEKHLDPQKKPTPRRFSKNIKAPKAISFSKIKALYAI